MRALDLSFWCSELCSNFKLDQFKVRIGPVQSSIQMFEGSIQPTVQFNSIQFKVQFKPTLQYINKMPEVIRSTLPRYCVRANGGSAKHRVGRTSTLSFELNSFSNTTIILPGGGREEEIEPLFCCCQCLWAWTVPSHLNIVKYRKTFGAFLAG